MDLTREVRVRNYIRGYHVYQRIWKPVVGEVAIAVLQEENRHDCYAVAILEEALLLAAISLKLFWLSKIVTHSSLYLCHVMRVTVYFLIMHHMK